jgi:chromatin segregation and condensation protein Rec8/ScpA/Scc1 (kleisin family)
LYREFKNAGELLKQQWNKNTQLFGRAFLSGSKDLSVFYPSAAISKESLGESMQSLLRIMEGIMPEQKTVAAAGLVTLQQKMLELTNRLKTQSSISFKGRASKENKGEIIVLFLAVLHLLANRLADVEQADQFGEITVFANGTSGQDS